MSPKILHGYHGTSVDAAGAILRERRFRASEGTHHWLGPGIYFWEDAPLRAWEWACDHKKQPAAVLRVEIEYRNVFNLLDIGNERLLHEIYRSIKEVEAAAEGWVQPSARKPPQQRAPALIDGDGQEHHIGGPAQGSRKRNELDCAVFDRLRDALWEQTGKRICAVRCAFAEGQMIYPSSFIFDRSHVQIVVLEPSIIQHFELMDSVLLAEKYKKQVLPWKERSKK